LRVFTTREIILWLLASVGKSLYHFAELDVTELTHYPEGIRDICERKIDGLIVENFLSQEDVSKVVSQLTRKGPFPDSPFGDVLIYGPALYVSNSDIGQYSERLSISELLRQLFSGGADFETRLTEVLGAMSGGRPVELPTTPEGSPYTPSTIRVLEEGQFMAGTLKISFFTARRVSTPVNPSRTGRSSELFVVLSASEAGGELILYDLEWSETDWPDKEHGGTKKNGLVGGKLIAEVMEDYDKMSISPRAGSLVVFDGR
jgi:hypothetical protein